MEPRVDSRFTFIESFGIMGDEQEITTAEDLKDIRKDLIDELSNEENTNTSHVDPEQDSSRTKDHMHVYLRIRPFTKAEIAQNESRDCVLIENSTSVILKAPRISLSSRCSDRGIGQMAQRFTFSHIYGPETKQKEMFETVKPLIEDVLNGQNCLVFTYGVTNSGKTHTFQGPDHDVGILPRAMNALFKSIEGKIYQDMNIKPQRSADFSKLTEMQVKEEGIFKKSVLHLFNESDQSNCNGQHSSLDASEAGGSLKSLSNASDFAEYKVAVRAPERIRFSIWVSFCEIYNETLYDLLDPVPCKYQKRKILRLVQDSKGNIYVKDLKWIQVSNAEEACMILKQGRKQQSIASTKANNLSSRSHCTFSIRILHVEAGSLQVTRVSELSLCDLAGSERNAKTKNEGDRLKEAGNINTSLLILGKCINALRHNQISKIQSHVPFRESKLTRYFQGFFSGRGKVCMIVNISQCASMYEETLHVLKFSAMAQKILLDCSKFPTCLVPKRSARALSLIINNAEIEYSLKRETISWDSSLEDIVEMPEGDLETTYTDVNQSEEEGEDEEDEEEENIVISKITYEKFLIYMQDLKNKIIEEKKEKVMMEKKIREEACQEMEKFMSQFENDLSERAKEDSKLTEDRIEKRNKIFQTLVKTCVAIDQNESVTQDCAEPEIVQENQVMGYIKSLEPDVAEIKKQAEIIHHHLVSAPDPQETIVQLEARLASAIQELNQTKEELAKNTAELKSYKTEVEKKSNETQKDIKIQKLMDELILKNADLNKVKDLLAVYEERMEDYSNMLESIQGKLEIHGISEEPCNKQMENPSINRKRSCENCQQEDEPPSKKGQFNKELHKWTSLKTLEQKVEGMRNELTAKDQAVTTQNEEIQYLKDQLALTQENLNNEKILEEQNQYIESLKLQLTTSADIVSKLTEQIENQSSNYEKIVLELQHEKELNVQHSQKSNQLELQIELSNHEIRQKEQQNKAMEEKISKLIDFQKESELNVVELKSTKDLLEKAKGESLKKMMEIESLQNRVSVLAEELDKAKAVVQSRDNKTIENLQKERDVVDKLLVQKSQQIQELDVELKSLKKQKAELQTKCTELKANEAVSQNLLQEKDTQLQELKANLKLMENEMQALMHCKENHAELEKAIENYQHAMEAQELEISKNKATLSRFEEQLKEREKCIADLQNKLLDSDKCVDHFKLNLKTQVAKLENEVRQAQDNWHIAQESLTKKEGELETKHLEFNKLKNELSVSASKCKNLAIDLQSKDEEYRELKEKYADTKKQIQQVETEISRKQEEEKLLKHKVSELERTKNQMTHEIEMKERTIQQLKVCHNEADLKNKVEILMTTLNEKELALRKLDKLLEESKTLHQEKEEQRSNEENKLTSDSCIVPAVKVEEAVHLLQTTKELQDKEKIIEDMKFTLTEQEETQTKQDELLEAKLKEIEELNAELEKWRCQVKEFEKKCDTLEHNTEIQFPEEIQDLKKQLVEMEDKQRCNRQKWLDEKMLLLKQVKEAEERRNKEMRKWTEERERYSKLQSEMENLTSEMIQKEKEMQKWRIQRDVLVKELEVQLGNLVTSNKQKDEEIKKLKVSAKENLVESDTVLDSSEVLTENGAKTSRFPKPELEIHFTPLQPNKMSVKEPSGNLISVKPPRSNNRKRKSFAMEENADDWENKKNTFVSRMIRNAPPLASTTIIDSASKEDVNVTAVGLVKNPSVSSLASHKKKDGTLQKIGDLLQNSPTVLQSKAKKLMESLSSPKNLEVEACNSSKAKRAKRKLYKQDISSPMNFPSQPIIELNEKESDHLIMKRRLRTRTAKITR
ncbi:kinesin-like protein KIF20B isoform X2 [Narcine bancroftii]|uniref:kinesin-like protein KIF20B isoform X2 n=1 Tax=Narcine bancroftii TaxID=1343680 RepID=UPI00383218C8